MYLCSQIQNNDNMNTSNYTPKKRTIVKVQSTYTKPKRLSKAGLWRLQNPSGIVSYIDYRAVCK